MTDVANGLSSAKQETSIIGLFSQKYDDPNTFNIAINLNIFPLNQATPIDLVWYYAQCL